MFAVAPTFEFELSEVAREDKVMVTFVRDELSDKSGVGGLGVK